MKITKLPVMLFVALASSLVFTSAALPSGYIAGQIALKDIYLDGATVTIFDNVNAEIMGTTTAGEKGIFQSGPLPQGSYKIHFIFAKYCVDEFLGAAGAHNNTFDLALNVSVKDDLTTDLAIVTVEPKDPVLCEPRECVPQQGVITGSVFDISTKQYIPNIVVLFNDAVNAFPLYRTRTGEKGEFYFKQYGCGPFDVKVRFIDPQGIYNPEYYGAGGDDSFAKGLPIDFADQALNISEDLAKQTPSQQIGNIIDDIQGILPPQDAQPLISSLLPGKALLEDTNPNNDKGACGVLNGTVNKIKGLLSNGRMSQADADAMAASVEILRKDLGCKN